MFENDSMPRRHLLQAVGAAGISSLSGCGAWDFSRKRSLRAEEISIAQQQEEWQLTATVENKATGFDSSEGGFSNVTLVGYSKSGDTVCTESIGDVPSTGDGATRTVRTTCTTFPFTITFSADESVCEDDTEILVSIYQGRRESVGHYWLADAERECDEGLPPSIPDSTVTPPDQV